jgi:hypothetical protein
MKRVSNNSATQGGWAETGNTHDGSGVIDNIANTGYVDIGDYVEISAGFPDYGRLRVTAKGANSITVAEVATSSETGVTVTSKPGYYTDGIPDLVSPTVLNSRWLNCIQEEIVNAIEDDGQTLHEEDNKQLTTAIRRRYAASLYTTAGQTINFVAAPPTGAYLVTGATVLTSLKNMVYSGGYFVVPLTGLYRISFHFSGYWLAAIAQSVTAHIMRKPVGQEDEILFQQQTALKQTEVSVSQRMGACLSVVVPLNIDEQLAARLLHSAGVNMTEVGFSFGVELISV